MPISKRSMTWHGLWSNAMWQPCVQADVFLEMGQGVAHGAIVNLLLLFDFDEKCRTQNTLADGSLHLAGLWQCMSCRLGHIRQELLYDCLVACQSSRAASSNARKAFTQISFKKWIEM